jgi:hypothetical protein
MDADEFASRSWRVDGITTKAERSGSGKWALVMKYSTSGTHMNVFAKKPFRSSDERYNGVTWGSKEEALQPANVQTFRDFVQVTSARAAPAAAHLT